LPSVSRGLVGGDRVLPMRFLPLAFATFSATAALVAGSAVGCGTAIFEETSTDAGSVRRDAAPVDATEAGAPLDDAGTRLPSCTTYCDLVMTHCTGGAAQYASKAECLAFCAHLPLTEPSRDIEEKNAASVACRQYWADGPARTSPETYCLAAGPFGGNTCGDRCSAFCSVVLSACSPDGGVAAYESEPACKTACVDYPFREAGSDGGGEGPSGPSEGDTLNCRLFWLRSATTEPSSCTQLGAQSASCKD
jgi:hypothetical protein